MRGCSAPRSRALLAEPKIRRALLGGNSAIGSRAVGEPTREMTNKTRYSQREARAGSSSSKSAAKVYLIRERRGDARVSCFTAAVSHFNAYVYVSCSRLAACDWRVEAAHPLLTAPQPLLSDRTSQIAFVCVRLVVYLDLAIPSRPEQR